MSSALSAAPSEPLVHQRTFIPRLRGRAGLTLSFAVILALVVLCVFAPLLAPHNPNNVDLTDTLAGTSANHLLGTDIDGRDILSRLIYGTRTSVLGPLVVVLSSVLIGVPLGMLAGYRKGWVDAVLSRVLDILFAFPALLLAIVIIATFGAGLWTATIAVTFIYVPILARVVRAAVLVEDSKPYVDACRVQGFSGVRIVRSHVLTNIAPIVASQAALNFGYSLLDLAGLSFLGLGVQPPTPDWGQMLNDGRQTIISHAYLEVCSAAIAITITVLAFNSLGSAIAQRAAGR